MDRMREVKDFVRQYYAERFEGVEFRPNVDWVPVSGKAFGPEELEALVECALKFWLTAGPYCKRFEEGLTSLTGAWATCLTNSGSSANLLAISSLCSKSLSGERLREGDEVITSAVGFPTTLNPILQNGLSAVLVDAEPGTYNPSIEAIETAVTPRTRAVFLAHCLGNPFEVDQVLGLCKERGMFLIEDTCDGLGALFKGKPVGSWGDLGTLSFYPAHHITTGEGGAVLCKTGELARIVRSLRDWGRHCWCEPGRDNTCGHRYDTRFLGLPEGYDHKYVYSDIGYNLKMTDLQAAIGEVQLRRLPVFAKTRDRNFKALHELFSMYEEWFVLPRAVAGAEPSWFGYPLTVRDCAPFSRTDLIKYLDTRKIATRPVFAGNLARQPAYRGHPQVRTSSGLANSDAVLESSLWLGVCQAIDEPRLDYMLESIEDWLRSYSHATA